MDIEIFLDSKEIENNNKKLIKKIINSKQHKNIVMNIINDKPDDSDLIDYIIKGYTDFKENHFLMKNNNILFEDFFKDKSKDKFKCFEKFNDTVQKAILRNSANKLKKRIISNKYEYLCDKKTDDIFLEMANIEFTKDELQKFIGKKISAFNKSDDLNDALLNLIEIKLHWSPEGIVKKLKKNCIEGKDFEISYNKDNQIIIDINSFEGSKTIGSRMWCITRESKMYNYYKEKEHIDYKYLFDFNKDASEDLSMVAFLINIDGNISEYYSKDDTELSNNKTLKKEYSELIKSNFPECGFSEKINKIKNNKELIYNPIKDEQFDPTNEEQVLFILDLISNPSLEISKKEMNKTPEIFNTSNMIGDTFKLIDEPAIEEYFSSNMRYYDVFDEFLDKKDFSKDTLKSIFVNKEIKDMFVEKWTSLTNYLLKNERHEEIISFMKDPSIINQIAKYSNFRDAKDYNIFSKISKNKSMTEYLEKNNSKDINKLFQLVKEEIININEKNEIKGEYKPNINVYLTTAIIYSKNKNNLDTLKTLIPEFENYRSDLSEFDYTKISFFNDLNKISSDGLKHFDFTKEKDLLTKSFVNNLLKEIIPKDYKHPKNNFKNYEMSYKNIFSIIKELDDNETITTEKENSFFQTPERIIKNNIFTRNVADFEVIDRLINTSIYSLAQEDNAEKSYFNILLDLGDKIGLNKSIDITSLIEETAKKEKYLKKEGHETKDYIDGFKILIERLNDLNILNTNNLLKYSADKNEKDEILDIANNIINKNITTKKFNIKNK